jgi:coenzyme F420 hydrogenase subunit beta
MDYNTAWGSILNRHLQPRCKLCADGTGEFADLVCADAWYGKDGYPDFTEREGRSLVLVRTPLGERLLDGAMDVVTTEPFDLTTLGAIQPYQFKRKAAMLARLTARRVLLRRVPSFFGMGLAHCARLLSLKVLVREFLGTLKRTAQGRI